MQGTTSRRGGGSSKQRQAEADVAHDLTNESPRHTSGSGSAKAEAVGRGAGSTVSSLPRMVLLVMLILVGTVFAMKMASEEVRIVSLFIFPLSSSTRATAVHASTAVVRGT
jgi:hypothetical protein